MRTPTRLPAKHDDAGDAMSKKMTRKHAERKVARKAVHRAWLERGRRQRPPETYDSVSAYFADYQGYVPLVIPFELSKLTATGMSFHDAYLKLLGRGSIIEIDPWPRPAPA